MIAEPHLEPNRAVLTVWRRAMGAALVVLGACGADPAQLSGVTVPDGFGVETVVEGLVGPTQIVRGPDGRLIVAQLNGGENDGTGQVLVVDDEGTVEVLYDGLQKPTGVAVVDDELWIMEKDRLSRGHLQGGGLEVVADGLASNGRSEGTLTATAEGRVLFNTSGKLSGGEVVTGSGMLWEVEPGSEPVPFATGFKHAYARTFDSEGTLWQTEIMDGTFDGVWAVERLVAVERGDDGGWPRCIGDRIPVVEFGGSEASCAEAVAAHAVFPPTSTPTSVAVAPWDPDVLLVALWLEGRVVTVSRTDGGEPETFLEGVSHPQHLLSDGDRLLVVDHQEGRILAIAGG